MLETCKGWCGVAAVLFCVVLCVVVPVAADPPPGYYDTVDATNGATLRASLHPVIDDHTRFPYTSTATDTWNILESADEDPNNASNILDVYKNASIAKFGGGVGPYEREHTWPSSYGFPNDNSQNMPFTDCHMLHLSDGSYNGSRSNKPYRYCDAGCSENPTDVNNGQGGGSGVYPGNSNWTQGSFTQGTWETWIGKRGNVARALMYMDVRYEGGFHGITGVAEPDLILTDNEALIDASNTGSNESVAYMGMLAALLQWHLDDPVDADERLRNDVVFSFQGNRNPFVDHPEWVACVFNDTCGCSVQADCDDGLFCNGTEDCVGGTCQTGSDPCPGQACDEVNDLCVPLAGGVPFINEFHYDNSGTDTGEFVEIAGPAGTDLTGWSVVGYNGNGGGTYQTANLSGVIPDQGGCMGTLDFAFVGMQNGSPDGLALVDDTGAVIEFISYEGSFVATNGPANGMTSVDIGVAEEPAPAIGLSLQLSGSGSASADFTWQAPVAETPGLPNNSQTFAGCGGCSVDPECDDGQFCNGLETCLAGSCQPGNPPNCDDGVACTDDSCNETTDSCENVANDGNCNDGLFCNGSESCSAIFGCQAGTPPNCNDGVACTDDSCNEGTDTCDNAPNHGICDDGFFCNGPEACNATLGCQAGTPPNCNDGVACTDDSCNEGTDSCDHVPNDAACDDALFCNGAETCHATLDCQSGIGINCDDGVACTDDTCNEGTDSCDSLANDANCDDGLFCNGGETCHSTLDCQPGTDPCAPDPCDEGSDTCGMAGGAELWMAFSAGVSVPGVGTVTNEDIVAYDLLSGTWSLVFDGSDVGLGSLAINGFALLPDGDILLTFTAAASIPGLTGAPSGTTADDSDIIRFTPTSLGLTTAGSFSFYFDGSDVGLSSNDEDIDAIGLTPSGQLILSVIGNFAGTGASGVDEDLFVFNATSLGSVTAGSFAMYFDGSDVGLASSTSEDIDAAGLTSSGNLLLSTLGNFSVSGLSGADEDVFEFSPTSLGSNTSGSFTMFLDLSTVGIATSADVIAVELIE